MNIAIPLLSSSFRPEKAPCHCLACRLSALHLRSQGALSRAHSQLGILPTCLLASLSGWLPLWTDSAGLLRLCGAANWLSKPCRKAGMACKQHAIRLSIYCCHALQAPTSTTPGQ